MAVYDGFFDAVQDEDTREYDRAYSAGDFTQYFGQFIGSGVCIHEKSDSFKVRLEDGAAIIGPGYLFIQGYWLKNDADYAVTLPASSTAAIAAHLNLGKRMIEIEARAVAQVYPDSLVLAIVDTAAGTVEDTRHNIDICGVIDSSGSLSGKVEYAVNYIDKEINTKLEQIEKDIAAQEERLDKKIRELQAVADSIVPPLIGSIKFSAAQNAGPEWLKCDGRFVKKVDYPELVGLLFDTDGETDELDFYWTSKYMQMEGCKWRGVAYANGIFVAGARNAQSSGRPFAYSRDGINWSTNVAAIAASIQSIAYGVGRFVAVGSTDTAGTNSCYYSEDGINWTASRLPAYADWSSVAFGGGKFVAVSGGINYSGRGSKTAAYSTNGISWSAVTLPQENNWRDVAYGGGKFVAIAGGNASTNIGAWSVDGINWTSVTLPQEASWVSISYGNGRFVAIAGDNSTSNVAAYSSDGINWTSITMPQTTYWNSVTYGGGLFVAIAGGEKAQRSESAYSTDGINWTGASIPNDANWGDVAYGGGKFVAVGSVPYNQFSALGVSACSEPFGSIRLPDLDMSGVPAYIKAKEAEK